MKKTRRMNSRDVLYDMTGKYVEGDTEIKAYIAPWALPFEDIPLHFKWNKGIGIDEIIVEVPEDFEVVEVLNVEKRSTDNNIIRISKVKDALASEEAYFGVVVSYRMIPPMLKYGGKIKTSFIRDGETITTFDLIAKIFRPDLKIVHVPEKLTITDRGFPRILPLHLRYIGFGDIKLRIEARIGGTIVSHGESLIYEIIKRLHESDVLNAEDPQSTEAKKENGEGMWVDPDYVRELAEDIHRRIEAGEVLVEEMNEEMIQELRQWLTDLKTRERFTEILFGRVKEILLSILMDILVSTPIDNVKLLDTRTRMIAKIKAPITEVDLRIQYVDQMSNEYPPVDVSLEIEDLRERRTEVLMELPIIIEKWDDKPYLNVRDMPV